MSDSNIMALPPKYKPTRNRPLVVNMSAPVAAEQAAAFVAAVSEPNDILEIRRLPSGESTWHTAGKISSELPRLTRQNVLGKQGVYIGVNPRREHGGKGDEGVALAQCVFADFDHTTVEDATNRIEAAGLPRPTIILNSGHGCHAYWKLSEPIIDLSEWTRLQKGTAALLGSDPAVCNPERIMRLPGFTNHKPPVANCELIECDPTRIYPLAELRCKIPVQQLAMAGVNRAAPVGETIADGERNKTLASLAGTMRRRRMGEHAIHAALSEENQAKCRPPLDEDEVRAIAHSIGRYPPTLPQTAKPASVARVEPYQPFPLDALPGVVAAYIREAAAAMGCDAVYLALPLLTALAGAIGNTRVIRLKSTWTEPAVLWAAVVADSGTLKSPALEAALRFVWKRQRELLKEHQRVPDDAERHRGDEGRAAPLRRRAF